MCKRLFRAPTRLVGRRAPKVRPVSSRRFRQFCDLSPKVHQRCDLVAEIGKVAAFEDYSIHAGFIGPADLVLHPRKGEDWDRSRRTGTAGPYCFYQFQAVLPTEVYVENQEAETGGLKALECLLNRPRKGQKASVTTGGKAFLDNSSVSRRVFDHQNTESSITAPAHKHRNRP